MSILNVEFPSLPITAPVFSTVPTWRLLPSPTVNELWLSTKFLFPFVLLAFTFTDVGIPWELTPTLIPLLLPVVVLVFCLETTSTFPMFPVTFPPSWLKPFSTIEPVLLWTSFTFLKLPFAWIVSSVFWLLLFAEIFPLIPFDFICPFEPIPALTPTPKPELSELYLFLNSTASFWILATLL